MTINLADFGMFKSQTVNDAAGNGGPMSDTPVVSGAAANLFAAANAAERLAGSTKYRKAFMKVGSDNNDALLNPNLFWVNYTPAQDSLMFFPATQTDVQSAITGSEAKYGSGQLNANVSGGAGTIVVNTESSSIRYFRNGGKIRISDKDTIGASGNEEYGVIDTVNHVGVVATINLVDPLANGYSASTTRVMSVYEPDDVAVTFDGVAIDADTDANVDFDQAYGNNIGSIEQVWTMTKLASGEWNLEGSTVGDLGDYDAEGTGGIEPNNPDFTKPYFTIPADAFSGVFVTDDSVVFATHPAAVPVWIMHVIPAGAGAFGNNTATLNLRGEALA